MNEYNREGKLTKSEMNVPTAWYSYSYCDLVDKDKKVPYGNTHNTILGLSRTLGSRYYELTDHLGNVLATVLDRRTAVLMARRDGGKAIDYYKADVVSASDYYPFGMQMPGRFKEYSWSRMGSQSQQKDDEVYGKGNMYAFKYRMNDTRINRFWSPDPLRGKYPHNSDYAFSENRLIDGGDLEGLEFYYGADGSLLWKYGNSTQVRLVDDNYLKTHDPNKSAPLGELNANSTDAGMTIQELNTRAFLSTIKQTENRGNDPLPYNAWNGFANGELRTFTDNEYQNAPDDYADHPGAPSGSSSSASGAYQILQGSFRAYKKLDNTIKDFSPQAQDKIAMIRYRKAEADIAKGDLKTASEKLTKRQGGEQFASLPGGSQSHGMSLGELRSMFKKNVSNELKGKSTIATPIGKLTQ